MECAACSVQHDPMRLRLKAIRKRLGLTQDQLAERVPFERPWISKLETGATWTSDTLAVLAAALAVPEHELLGYLHPPDDEVRGDQADVVRAVLALSPKGVEFIKKQLEVAAQLGLVAHDTNKNGGEDG